MSVSKSFTTKEVARLCCVSDATVKRWEDAGLLNSERTNGGHRRFRIEEVLRFQREQQLGLKQTNCSDSAFAVIRRRENKFQADSEIFQPLISGCEEESSNILLKSFFNHQSLGNIFDEIICPAMKKIVELRTEGELNIAHERLAKSTIISAVHKLRFLLPVKQTNGKGAVCCAIEGDNNELSTHLAQMILENQGYEVLNFGANMPFYALSDVVEKMSPQILFISAASFIDFENLVWNFKNFAEKLEQSETILIFGGAAFQDLNIRKHFPADFIAENFTAMAQFTHKTSLKAA